MLRVEVTSSDVVRFRVPRSLDVSQVVADDGPGTLELWFQVYAAPDSDRVLCQSYRANPWSLLEIPSSYFQDEGEPAEAGVDEDGPGADEPPLEQERTRFDVERLRDVSEEECQGFRMEVTSTRRLVYAEFRE